MKYVPLPIAMLAVGKPLPVDVWSPEGRLLLRKGQPIVSEQHREKLYAHDASVTESEAQAWQRAYERMVHALLYEGVDVQVIARMPMPSAILRRDYHTGAQLKGGWLDMQEVLRGILYQGGLSINPLERLLIIERKARELLQADVDESLFCLFQALADNTLGYCATHALLCGVVSDLVASRLGVPPGLRQSLLSAALTMNIGMARDQDSLSRQRTKPTEAQRAVIRAHPERSMAILTELGIDDPAQLDIVRWHHEPEAAQASPQTLLARQILAMADIFVAKMAARTTRAALPPLAAAKSIYLQSEGHATPLGSAMATAVGFYPPGSYVRLVNGETAVAVQRGARANTPWVIRVLDKDGMPYVDYTCYDTTDPAYAVAAPVVFKQSKVLVSVERVRRARVRIPRVPATPA